MIIQRAFNFALRLVAISVLMAILTSCSAAVPIAATPTAGPTATARSVTPITVKTPTDHRPTCTVQAGSVYLRSGSGMSFAVKQVLHRGDLLRVLARGEWLKVETAQNAIGWVYSKYCKGGN